MSTLSSFAASVGPAAAGPVVAVGGRTQWDVGGAPSAGTREVRAPVGIVTHEPAEMTVRVGAGTTVDDLAAALGSAGQRVALPAWPGATVGGVVAVGRSGVTRLGWGPLRDAVLEVRYVSADGDVVTAGGPTVKNVSGYDLVRLLVGSLGTLGLIGEVVLRTTPRPRVSRWFAVEGADPLAVRAALHRPSAVLWDGATTWLLLEGNGNDVDAQAARVGATGSAVEGPPPLPPHRWSLAPGAVASLPTDGGGAFIAEIGVGIVHRHEPQPARASDPQVAVLQARVKALFDPTGRLGPGRSVP